jgi:hypothetical protein
MKPLTDEVIDDLLDELAVCGHFEASDALRQLREDAARLQRRVEELEADAKAARLERDDAWASANEMLTKLDAERTKATDWRKRAEEVEARLKSSGTWSCHRCGASGDYREGGLCPEAQAQKDIGDADVTRMRLAMEVQQANHAAALEKEHDARLLAELQADLGTKYKVALEQERKRAEEAEARRLQDADQWRATIAHNETYWHNEQVAAIEKARQEARPALEAALALVEAVVDDYSADHHQDDCPGDCEDHTVGHFINETHRLATEALRALKSTKEQNP